MNIEQMLMKIENQSHQFYEEKLREQLSEQNKDWLQEQLLTFILKEKHSESFHEISSTKKKYTHETLSQRKERIARIRALKLTSESLRLFKSEVTSYTREYLETNKYLLSVEHKGLGIILRQQRTEKGEALLTKAKDILFALLFCGTIHDVHIARNRRDELTITLASSKANCLENFMLAITEYPVKGIWYDPEGVSDDENAMNTVMQVEFSDDKEGLCSSTIMCALKLINNLEINEEILYCRIEQAKFSSLV